MSTVQPATRPFARPAAASSPFRSALQLALLFASIKFVLHLVTNLWQAHLGWGYFGDELYYIACGRHLAWGYVDHGPVVAVQARLAELIFGRSLAGIRMFSAAAGAAQLLLTGMLAWALGGRRPAQGLAMIAVLVAPVYLALDSFLSMNSFESMFWMACLLPLILLDQGRLMPARAWAWFGVSAGLGLLNKPSMAFFLAALAIAMLLTPQRRLLFTRSTALGVGLMLLITMPHLLWQIHNHWPTLEFLHNGRAGNKNMVLGPVAFFVDQWKTLNPAGALVWIPGIVWLLRRSAQRWLGVAWLLFFGLMFALHAKDYYVVPIYPLLFAAGGVAWEQRFAQRRRVEQQRALAFPVAELTLLVSGLLLLPMTIPVFTPQTWVRYAKATHLYEQSSNSENESSGVLPQIYAYRFGWQEEADKVAAIYHRLPPEDRARAVVYASNYAEASSVMFLTAATDHPPVISGHNNYWLWGPQGATGEVVISVNGATLAQMLDSYRECVVAARMDHPLSMPYERRNIYLCRGRKKNLASEWADFKHYF